MNDENKGPFTKKWQELVNFCELLDLQKRSRYVRVYMTIANENKCKKCNSENVIFVEYSWDHPEHYDGTSEVECLTCGARFGRWSGKELGPNEYEKRVGRKRVKKDLSNKDKDGPSIQQI